MLELISSFAGSMKRSWNSAAARSKLHSIEALLRHRYKLSRILSNIGWLLIDNVFRLGIGLAMTILLARYLAPDQFGLFNYALAVIALISPVARLGVDNMVLCDLVKTPSDCDIILGTTFGLRIVSATFVSALSISLLALLGLAEFQVLMMIGILSLGVILRSFETVVFWFQSQIQSKNIVYIRNLALSLSAILQIMLVRKQAPLFAFTGVLLSEAIFLTVGLIIVYQLYGPGFSRWRFRADRAKLLLRRGWPLILSSLAITIYMKVDQIMLGNILGGEAVGVYSAATRVSEAFYFLPTVLVSSITPVLVEVRERNTSLYHLHLQRLFSLMIAMGIAVAVIVTLTAAPLIHGLFSSDYAAAVSILVIHIWASPFVFLGVAQGPWDVNEDLQQLALARFGMGSIMNIILNLLLIPIYGPIGATVATVVSYIAINYLANFIHPKTRVISRLQSKAFIFSQLLPTRSS